LGVDLVCHSVTKYFAGHSDVVAGAICGSKERIRTLHDWEGALFGGIIAPFNAWLILRGLRTLKLRLDATEVRARAVHGFLKDRPEVAEVFYCGADDFAQRGLYERQFKGTGGL
ncbi:MAG: PLP-dependent transferase, partial [Fimbriimonadaceae bacterium]